MAHYKAVSAVSDRNGGIGKKVATANVGQALVKGIVAGREACLLA